MEDFLKDKDHIDEFCNLLKEDVRKLEQDYLPLVKLSLSELCFRFKGEKLDLKLDLRARVIFSRCVILAMSESKILEKN